MFPKVKMLEILARGGVIAVIRRVEANQAQQIADALVSGGITALEVTVDSPDTYQVIKTLSKRYGERALVGAGTVLDGYAAYQAIHSGADFIFSPSFHADVVKTTLRYGKIAIPGVMTPTEAMTALEHGADAVKIFPAGTLGASFFKDVKAPCPQIPMIPTGGVNLENIASFIRAGAVAAGAGGSLMDKKDIQNGDYDAIKKRAALFVKTVQEARE